MSKRTIEIEIEIEIGIEKEENREGLESSLTVGGGGLNGTSIKKREREGHSLSQTKGSVQSDHGTVGGPAPAPARKTLARKGGEGCCEPRWRGDQVIVSAFRDLRSWSWPVGRVYCCWEEGESQFTTTPEETLRGKRSHLISNRRPQLGAGGLPLIWSNLQEGGRRSPQYREACGELLNIAKPAVSEEGQWGIKRGWTGVGGV